MSPIAILSTLADTKRPGLTFRIEFDSEDQVKEWLDSKYFLEERNRIWMLEGEAKEQGINTAVTVFHEDGTITQKKVRGRWDQIAYILELAEDIERGNAYGGRGRPARRVLQTTTSKERRESKGRTFF